MKRFCLALVLLFSGLCYSQTVVQCANNNGTANTSIQITFGVATTAGNIIVIMSGQGANNTSTMSMTDSASQTGWTQTGSGYSSANTGSRAAMFWRANSASLTSVTATWSGGLSTTVTGVACEISGVATASPEDNSVNSNNNTASATATSGSLTTTNAVDILIFAIRTGGNISNCVAGSSFAIPSNATSVRVCLQTEDVTSTQSGTTTTMTWTTTQTVATVFLALKASTAVQNGITKERKIEQLESF